MRIYMIGAKGFPAATVPGGGGIERHVEEMATRLATRGHDVFVYVRAHSSDPLLKTYKRVKLIRLSSIHTKHLDTISHVFFATLHVLRRPPGIIHYHGVGPATLAWIPRLFKWRSRTVVTIHRLDRTDTKWSMIARAYLAFGEWASCHFPHATVTVSHVLQVYCRRLFGKDVTYIPNGSVLPGPQGEEAVRAHGLRPGKYFLAIGRPVPGKAFDVLVEAFGKVETDFSLVIAGDAEFETGYVRKLETLAARDPRVRLVGFQKGAALSQLYAHAYAFVIPSRSEGLSTATIEAMAHGKLVIMSDIRENLELIDHSGISFPVDNRKKLSEALRWALDDPAMVSQRGKRAREVVRKNYTWDRVVDRLETLYRTLY